LHRRKVADESANHRFRFARAGERRHTSRIGPSLHAPLAVIDRRRECPAWKQTS
jgi:hypothetical protein